MSEPKPLSKEERDDIRSYGVAFICPVCFCRTPDDTMARALDTIDEYESRQQKLVEALTKIAITYNSNPCCLESTCGPDGKEHRDWCHQGIAAEALREIEEGDKG